MIPANGDEAAVSCYAGGAYPQRPLSFVWQGERHEVAEVQREWQEPGRRLFRVRSEEGEVFDLTYSYGEDRWTITQK